MDSTGEDAADGLGDGRTGAGEGVFLNQALDHQAG